MWFKQNEQKSPQQPEATPQQQPQQQQPQHTPAPPATPVAAEPARPAPYVAPPAPAPAANGSRITSGITVKGEISGREDLWISGYVDGALRFDTARIVVGAGGRTHGKLEAREIVVEGHSDGDLNATERLEVTSTGTARGDASAPRVSLQDGAIFHGSVEVVRAGESRHSDRGSQPARSGQSQSQSQPQASRTPRPQNTQAAGAAAAASTPLPAAAGATAGASTAASGSLTESGNGEGSGAAILLRGIAVDPSEKAE
jgi:cytoskeletal protein CcmA (bactofilin family)